MNNGKADFVIIVPPAGIKNTVYPPYGAMYIASSLMKKGLKASIINVDTRRYTNSEIADIVRRSDPRYIGFSGIVAPSYKYIKTLSAELKSSFEDKIQILGGGLSSAAEVVLRNSPVDYVVSGEGDATITELVDCIDNKRDPSKVQGIYYRDGKECVYTGPRKPITPLDSLPYPAFDLVEMEKYMPDGLEFIRYFMPNIRDRRILDPRRKRRMITIPTSRGCFGHCSFCFRAYPGIRTHSMKYVFDLMEYCVKKYDVGFFSLGDECFAPSKARNWEFIEEYKKRKLDVIFRIIGMRVDTVDREILKAYKDIGCWMIEYGFEAGNQRMLNIIDKRVTVEQNRQVAKWTNEAGIFTSPTLVLAMPGETDETVDRSIEFLKSLDLGYKQYQWSYALPIPGAPLYEFAKLSGAITDEDEYLQSLDGKVAGAGVFHVNLTDVSDGTAAGWADRVRDRVDEHYFRRRYVFPAAAAVIDLIKKFEVHLRRGDLMSIIRNKVRSSSPSFRAHKKDNDRPKVRYHKQKDIVVEEFIKGLDDSVINREMSLKMINERLRGVLASRNGGKA